MAVGDKSVYHVDCPSDWICCRLLHSYLRADIVADQTLPFNETSKDMPFELISFPKARRGIKDVEISIEALIEQFGADLAVKVWHNMFPSKGPFLLIRLL